MSDLVFIAFPTEEKAEEVRQKVLSLQREYLIELGDAVVVVKDANGHIKLNQLINLTTTGAASGALWGTLIGLMHRGAPVLAENAFAEDYLDYVGDPRNGYLTLPLPIDRGRGNVYSVRVG